MFLGLVSENNTGTTVLDNSPFAFDKTKRTEASIGKVIPGSTLVILTTEVATKPD